MNGVWQIIQRFRNVNKEECKKYILDNFPSHSQAEDSGCAFKTRKSSSGRNTYELRFHNIIKCKDVDSFLEYCHAQIHQNVTDVSIPVNLVFDIKSLTWKNLTFLYNKWSSDQLFSGVSMYVAIPRISSINIISPNETLFKVFIETIVSVCFTERMRNRTTISL